MRANVSSDSILDLNDLKTGPLAEIVKPTSGPAFSRSTEAARKACVDARRALDVPRRASLDMIGPLSSLIETRRRQLLLVRGVRRRRPPARPS